MPCENAWKNAYRRPMKTAPLLVHAQCGQADAPPRADILFFMACLAPFLKGAERAINQRHHPAASAMPGQPIVIGQGASRLTAHATGIHCLRRMSLSHLPSEGKSDITSSRLYRGAAGDWNRTEDYDGLLWRFPSQNHGRDTFAALRLGAVVYFLIRE